MPNNHKTAEYSEEDVRKDRQQSIRKHSAVAIWYRPFNSDQVMVWSSLSPRSILRLPKFFPDEYLGFYQAQKLGRELKQRQIYPKDYGVMPRLNKIMGHFGDDLSFYYDEYSFYIDLIF